MSEITTAKYSEKEVDQLVKEFGDRGEDKWARNQTWKAIRIHGVRILHAYKSGKSVFQGDMKNANRMIAFLEHQQRVTKTKATSKETQNSATQTEDDWIDDLLNEKRRSRNRVTTREIR